MNASSGVKGKKVPKTVSNGRTKAIEAPRAAPDEVPIKNGSARGLRNMPWKRTPATPSAAPTSAAPNTPGIRTCHTITPVGYQGCAKWKRWVPFNSTWTIVLMGMDVEPKLIAKSITISNTALNIEKRSVEDNSLTPPRSCFNCDFCVTIFIDLPATAHGGEAAVGGDSSRPPPIDWPYFF